MNSRLFLSARNGINFFELSVHQDKDTVQKILMNTDVSFNVQLATSDGTTMEKRFGIETNYTSRTKRWSPWSYWSIHQPHLFPNYNQHRCCGCYSGCGPVAWAQIFAYYDRYTRNLVWLRHELFKAIENLLTIRPVAFEGEGYNCFSITQLVGQKKEMIKLANAS